MAVKTRNLVNFSAQLDDAFPHRVKPDGWIGDAAHKTRTSGHNADDTPGSKPAWNGDPDSTQEVRATDVANQLGDGYDGQDLVNHLIKVPHIETVFRYFIHAGRMYHVRDGYRATPYTGDPHNEHVHCEGAWTQAADNNASFDFHLEEIVMPSPAEYAAEVIKRLDDAPVGGKGRHLGPSVDFLVDEAYANRARVAELEAKLDELTEKVTAPPAA